ncbi:MAG: spore coat protein CotJB [Wujia sp.]
MDNMCKSELFELINQISFMVDDIALYLNTHPDCKEAIEAYNHFKEIRHEAIKDYTENFGPISKYNVNADNYWCWVNQPWPWEGECNR